MTTPSEILDAAPVVRPKLSAAEWQVLNFLGPDGGEDDWRAYPFRPIERATGLPQRDVRRACRSLSRKGLAAYERALCTEDGEFVGAGYRATDAGSSLYWSLPARAAETTPETVEGREA